MLFLWRVDFADVSHEIKLVFLDSSSRNLRQFSVTDYKPYFLTISPLSEDKRAAVANFQGEVEVVEKRSLYTDETIELAKIKAKSPILLKKLSRQFSEIWEIEIDYGKSYIYDTNMVFGAPYTQVDNEFIPVRTDSKELEQKFNETFCQEKEKPSPKRLQIENWFNLCHQPVPRIAWELLGGEGKQENTEEQIYLAFLLARIANIPVPEAYISKRVSDWIKSINYTYLRRNNFLIPTSKELRRNQKTHRVLGALTIEPEAGIYFNTVICDFESLYPSCIDSYNLSYETVDCHHKECKNNKIPEAKHHVCLKRKGFYSILIGALKDLRIHWFKTLAQNPSISYEERQRAEATSKLLKLLSVSSYGVTVRIHGVACPPLAESITGCGRWALQTTWDLAKQKGMHPIYGDTDSVFLDDPTRKQVQTLISTVKKQLLLDLAVERQYTLCVLSKAKKAYFGITKEGVPDLKGLAAIKSNAPNFIQQIFRKCVQVLANVRNIDQYVLAKAKIVTMVYDSIKMLRKREVNLEDLVYAVKLYYDPNERTGIGNVMSQPYQCAQQLIDNDEKLSSRDIVHFVKVKPFNYKGKTFTVKPVNYVKSLAEINVEDYVRNLTTALEQTFEPMEIKLEGDRKLTYWLRT